MDGLLQDAAPGEEATREERPDREPDIDIDFWTLLCEARIIQLHG